MANMFAVLVIATAIITTPAIETLFALRIAVLRASAVRTRRYSTERERERAREREREREKERGRERGE